MTGFTRISAGRGFGWRRAAIAGLAAAGLLGGCAQGDGYGGGQGSGPTAMPGAQYSENADMQGEELNGGGTAVSQDLESQAPEEADISYEAAIEGVPEADLLDLLQQSSQLIALTDRPPASLAALRRRAEGDRARLIAALRSEGFYSPAIEVDIDRSVVPVLVTLKVATGDQYLLAEYQTRYLGSPPPAPEAQPSLDDLGLHIGMPARAPSIVAAQRALLDFLGRHAHPLAKVLNRETLVDHGAKIMTVRLDVDPGPAARFGPVAFDGLDTVEADYLRDLLTWTEGEPFDKDKLDAARRALSATGLFSSVTISPAEAVAADGALPVTVDFVEAKHRSIGFGASYSTGEGFSGDVFWEHRNFFGRNEQLRLSLTAAQIEQILSARLRKPSFLRADQDLVIDGALSQRDTDAFEERSFTGAAALERPFGERWRGSAGVTGEYSIIEDEKRQSTFQLVGFPVGATYDSSDSLLDPTEGARLSTLAIPYTGHGEKPLFFAAGTAVGSAYLALDSDRRYVLAGRAKLGSLIGEETTDIPANKRLFAGGGGSIRGYEFQSVGPLDAENNPLGGRSALELSAEVRVKITDEVGLVPFVDGGTVYDSVYPDFDETLRWAGGLGARYFSAVGPIRLDIAVPLNRRDIDDAFQFYISLGQAF